MTSRCKDGYHPFYKCVTSPSSLSASTNKCECPPEYYCATFCAEGEEIYDVRSNISWQHFPKSTSTRSICFEDSSKEISRKSITDSEEKAKTEKEPSSESEISAEPPTTMSIAQLDALHYLEIRHIYELLNFLIGHLVCNEPDDPINFLVSLLDKCISFRDSFGEPPLLFSHSHIASLYGTFDPFARGNVSVDQYKEALNYLRIDNVASQKDEEPPTITEGQVDVKHFEFEAGKRMIHQLRQMLRVPQPWEEDREKWKRKLAKLSARKEKNMANHANRENSQGDVGGNKKCSCSHLDVIRSTGCKCVIRHVPSSVESEQLFLDYYTQNTKTSPF